MTKKLLFLYCIFLGFYNLSIAQKLTSPNGDLEMEFSLLKNGTPTYTLIIKIKK